jgi:hypothetical protein
MLLTALSSRCRVGNYRLQSFTHLQNRAFHLGNIDKMDRSTAPPRRCTRRAPAPLFTAAYPTGCSQVEFETGPESFLLSAQTDLLEQGSSQFTHTRPHGSFTQVASSAARPCFLASQRDDASASVRGDGPTRLAAAPIDMPPSTSLLRLRKASSVSAMKPIPTNRYILVSGEPVAFPCAEHDTDVASGLHDHATVVASGTFVPGDLPSGAVPAQLCLFCLAHTCFAPPFSGDERGTAESAAEAKIGPGVLLDALQCASRVLTQPEVARALSLPQARAVCLLASDLVTQLRIAPIVDVKSTAMHDPAWTRETAAAVNAAKVSFATAAITLALSLDEDLRDRIREGADRVVDGGLARITELLHRCDAPPAAETASYSRRVSTQSAALVAASLDAAWLELSFLTDLVAPVLTTTSHFSSSESCFIDVVDGDRMPESCFRLASLALQCLALLGRSASSEPSTETVGWEKHATVARAAAVLSVEMLKRLSQLGDGCDSVPALSLAQAFPEVERDGPFACAFPKGTARSGWPMVLPRQIPAASSDAESDLFMAFIAPHLVPAFEGASRVHAVAVRSVRCDDAVIHVDLYTPTHDATLLQFMGALIGMVDCTPRGELQSPTLLASDLVEGSADCVWAGVVTAAASSLSALAAAAAPRNNNNGTAGHLTATLDLLEMALVWDLPRAVKTGGGDVHSIRLSAAAVLRNFSESLSNASETTTPFENPADNVITRCGLVEGVLRLTAFVASPLDGPAFALLAEISSLQASAVMARGSPLANQLLSATLTQLQRASAAVLLPSQEHRRPRALGTMISDALPFLLQLLRSGVDGACQRATEHACRVASEPSRHVLDASSVLATLRPILLSPMVSSSRSLRAMAVATLRSSAMLLTKSLRDSTLQCPPYQQPLIAMPPAGPALSHAAQSALAILLCILRSLVLQHFATRVQLRDAPRSARRATHLHAASAIDISSGTSATDLLGATAHFAVRVLLPLYTTCVDGITNGDLLDAILDHLAVAAWHRDTRGSVVRHLLVRRAIQHGGGKHGVPQEPTLAARLLRDVRWMEPGSNMRTAAATIASVATGHGANLPLLRRFLSSDVASEEVREELADAGQAASTATVPAASGLSTLASFVHAVLLRVRWIDECDVDAQQDSRDPGLQELAQAVVEAVATLYHLALYAPRLLSCHETASALRSLTAPFASHAIFGHRFNRTSISPATCRVWLQLAYVLKSVEGFHPDANLASAVLAPLADTVRAIGNDADRRVTRAVYDAVTVRTALDDLGAALATAEWLAVRVPSCALFGTTVLAVVLCSGRLRRWSVGCFDVAVGNPQQPDAGPHGAFIGDAEQGSPSADGECEENGVDDGDISAEFDGPAGDDCEHPSAYREADDRDDDDDDVNDACRVDPEVARRADATFLEELSAWLAADDDLDDGCDVEKDVGTQRPENVPSRRSEVFFASLINRLPTTSIPDVVRALALHAACVDQSRCDEATRHRKSNEAAQDCASRAVRLLRVLGNSTTTGGKMTLALCALNVFAPHVSIVRTWISDAVRLTNEGARLQDTLLRPLSMHKDAGVPAFVATEALALVAEAFERLSSPRSDDDARGGEALDLTALPSHALLDELGDAIAASVTQLVLSVRTPAFPSGADPSANGWGLTEILWRLAAAVDASAAVGVSFRQSADPSLRKAGSVVLHLQSVYRCRVSNHFNPSAVACGVLAVCDNLPTTELKSGTAHPAAAARRPYHGGTVALLRALEPVLLADAAVWNMRREEDGSGEDVTECVVRLSRRFSKASLRMFQQADPGSPAAMVAATLAHFGRRLVLIVASSTSGVSLKRLRGDDEGKRSAGALWDRDLRDLVGVRRRPCTVDSVTLAAAAYALDVAAVMLAQQRLLRSAGTADSTTTAGSHDAAASSYAKAAKELSRAFGSDLCGSSWQAECLRVAADL